MMYCPSSIDTKYSQSHGNLLKNIFQCVACVKVMRGFMRKPSRHKREECNTLLLINNRDKKDAFMDKIKNFV